MNVFQAAWLGVVQGLTEFLPISSSAHLILVRDLFGWQAGPAEIAFDVACHLGTLCAVLAYFRDDVINLVGAAPGAVMGRGDDAARTGRRVLVATVPIVLVGGFLADQVERLRDPAVVAVALAVGALVLLVADAIGQQQRRAETLSVLEAIGLGCAQAAALVPGVSRSGAVITVALLQGLTRQEAARFTFLIGMPAILGGGLRAAWMLGWDGITESTAVLVVGFVASGLVGYGAVAALLRYVVRHSLAPFAYYRLVLAGVLLLSLWA